MKISVIVALRNCAPFVEDCVRSILAQTHRAHEVIIVDDASTDDTVARIQAMNVPEVRVIRLATQGGVSVGRNAGVEAATGDWIAFLDGDDRWYSNHLSEAARWVAATTDVAYMPGRHYTDGHGKVWGLPTDFAIAGATTGRPAEAYLDLHDRTTYLNTSGWIIRRQRLIDVGGFDPALTRRQDVDLWLRVLHGQTWTMNPTPTTVYRVDNPASLSRAIASGGLFYLRAVDKNADRYAGSKCMARILRTGARRAVTQALTYGSAEDVTAAWTLAEPYLRADERTILNLARNMPRVYRLFSRVRERYYWITHQLGRRDVKQFPGDPATPPEPEPSSRSNVTLRAA